MATGQLILLLASLVALCEMAVETDVAKRMKKCNAGFYKNPMCVDNPAGYWCECGTGFEWNSQICMTDSVDSRLEFKKSPAGYAILLGKNLPSLEAFTVAAWLKIHPNITDHNPTLIAYAVGKVDEFRINVGKTFNITIGKTSSSAKNWGLEADKWIHVVVTWERSGVWKLYKNGAKVARSGRRRSNSPALPMPDKPIESGGDLTIGYMAQGLEDRAFLGELAHVHVWNTTLDDSYIKTIARDCTFTYCGNVAEWVDFRSGTRGNVKLRWPSNVFDKCTLDKAEDCNAFCSLTMGQQCNQGEDENVLWPRTPSGSSTTMPCPGGFPGSAIRSCTSDGDGLTGIWNRTDVSPCVSVKMRKLKIEISNISSIPSRIPLYIQRLHNWTSDRITNPAELSAKIEILRIMIDAQAEPFKGYKWGDPMLQFPQEPLAYPEFGSTMMFIGWVLDTVNNLTDPRNDIAWNATLPRGGQAVQLLKVMEKFNALLGKSMLRHEKRGDISFEKGEAKRTFIRTNVAAYIETARPVEYYGSHFPELDAPTLAPDETPVMGKIRIPDTLFSDLDVELSDKLMVVYYIRYEKIARYLPNHPEQVIVQYYRDKDLEHKHKEDNVNSVVITTGVYAEVDVGDALTNLTEPLWIDLKYLNSFNISNPECVYIDMTNGPNDWSWDTDEATNMTSEGDEGVTCYFYRLGTFAVTTDMYDINWDPGEPPHFAVTAAGYIGIVFVTTMVAFSIWVYFYLRCTSDTVAVHRNLGISIILLHVLFMIGITRNENAVVCKIFGIFIHFFFVSSFAWVCNEAFNLNTEVSNSIHSDTQQQRPMMRYYVIGWLIPAIIVAVLIQTQWETYFDPDVCFVAFENIWFFAGPAVGFWAVTVFVLAYTGKDIMESSYSKDKEANRVIGNQYKGCWVQTFLMAIAWAFVIISVDMFSIIPQILFAMFAILQGAFFFVFYCALDGEVTEILAERRAAMGFNVSSHGIQRSSKYSVYRRYLPPRSSSRSRAQSPAHIHQSGEMTEFQGSGEGGPGGSGSGADTRSPTVVRWGTTAVQALRRQREIARKDSDAKREVLSRFFSDEEVKGALDNPPTPVAEPDNTTEEDRLVTAV